MNTENEKEPLGETGQPVVKHQEPAEVQADKNASDVLMDYEKLANNQGEEAHPENAQPHIGLSGGQSKYDDGGIPVDQYAGPASVPSTEYKNPAAPYHTGPDSGTHNQANPDTDRPEVVH